MKTFEQFSFLRHGEKQPAGVERVPLSESGLTAEQQALWQEAAERLGSDIDPELAYESLPAIAKMAKELYERLPKKAVVVFSSTDRPRTLMTANLLSADLLALIQQSEEKQISVEFLLEPKWDQNREGIAHPAHGIDERWLTTARALEGDTLVDEYIEHGGARSHERELEVFFRIIQNDLQRSDSLIRQRAEELRLQVEDLYKKFADEGTSVFFYGVGHISSLVALDVAFNGRKKYESVDDMPKPLELWKVKTFPEQQT